MQKHYDCDYDYDYDGKNKIHALSYRVLQTIQMKFIFIFVLAEPAVLGSAKTALKFKYEI